ncbi:hypothetical protein UlMin_045080 [Ulmus minor]
MAFWGIEVKPGKPFTHYFDGLKGRLHVSMASLGHGSAAEKSVLQCNVGNNSPVLLCSLYPERTESLQLNLEFEEAVEVMFSVIGPRSIHLSGYYMGKSRQPIQNEESESYGEDIADTDTQISDEDDEEDYEGSFINDDDPEVFPHSSMFDDEECVDYKKSRNVKSGRKQLRKKFQVSDSDNEECSQQKNVANGNRTLPVSSIDDEEDVPISSLYKIKTTGNKGRQEEEENAVEETDETNNKQTEGDGNHDSKLKGNYIDSAVGGQPMWQSGPSDLVPPSSEVHHRNCGISKKKRKERPTEEEQLESDKTCGNNIHKEQETQQGEAKVESMDQYLVVEHGKKQKMANVDEEAYQNDEKPKKKRKEQKNEKKTSSKISTGHHMNGVKETEDGRDEQNQKMANDDVDHQNDEKPKKKSKEQKIKKKTSSKINTGHHGNGVTKDGQDEQNQKSANDWHFTDENQSEDKKAKKKKKNKTQDKGDALNTDTTLSEEEKKTDATASHVRILKNGVIAEEIESGEPDGEIAFSGKKISVHYVGKLKSNGEIIDSNVGSSPFKFRLGAGRVIDGWDVGLEGMRVGEKRKLTVPPSMGYGSIGNGGSIPPDSWLVYEVELVKVR